MTDARVEAREEDRQAAAREALATVLERGNDLRGASAMRNRYGVSVDGEDAVRAIVVHAAPLLAQVAALQAEVDGARDALRHVIINAGGVAHQDVSTQFLCLAPEEVRLLRARALAAEQRAEVLERAAIHAALCLSGYIGEGISIVDYEEPEDAYFRIVEALGQPDADEDDLRAALEPTS